MDRLNIGSRWDDVKERLKENDINLTDQDLEYREGGEEELLERLARKMKKSKDEVREYIQSIAANEDRAG
ncbi:MAG: general stress protein CsbD [Chitinophagaceae bacterium]|nr:MAG: general stress protein CsbD [Chitinophagaceae bacterium]